MNKSKLFAISILSVLVLSCFVSLEATVYADDEAELLAKLKPKDLVPLSILIANATVDVDIVTRGGSIETRTFSVETGVFAPVIMSTEEESGKIAVNPDVDEDANLENWGIPDLMGDKNYLIQNTTNDDGAAFTIADNFATEQYPYLVLENLMSLLSTGAITLKISFGATADANITDIAVTYNKTIINAEVMPIASNIWYNLVLETNETFPYVINIDITNFDMTGHYVFEFENDKFIFDTRYGVFYTDIEESVLASMKYSVTEINGEHYMELRPSEDRSMLLPLSVTYDELNVSKMLAVPSRIDFRDDMYVRMTGWLDAEDLENDLKAAWKYQLVSEGKITDADRIVDYNLSRVYWQQTLNFGLTKMIKRSMIEELAHSTDYKSLVNNVMKDILPISMLTVHNEAIDHIRSFVTGDYGTRTIDGDFWAGVGDFFNNIGSGIAGVVNNLIDAPANTLEALGSAAGNIITPIGQTITGIAPAVTNMVTDSIGHVSDGVVDVVGVAGDVGAGLMDTIKVPLIIAVSILAVGAAGVGIFYLVKNKKAVSKAMSLKK